ncbi:hypothetical protein DRO61_10055 [Candidatus Bathyarchaeota archaeon]|nr:MAG: hypothetical protein DRO61_10055 [Candidatus Bathyarchaeota archaeon]
MSKVNRRKFITAAVGGAIVAARLAEDTAFPLEIGETDTKVNISFKVGDKKLIIERDRKY